MFGPNTPGCNESFWLNQCSQVQMLQCQDLFTKASVLVTFSNLSDVRNKQENVPFNIYLCKGKEGFFLPSMSSRHGFELLAAFDQSPRKPSVACCNPSLGPLILTQTVTVPSFSSWSGQREDDGARSRKLATTVGGGGGGGGRHELFVSCSCKNAFSHQINQTRLAKYRIGWAKKCPATIAFSNHGIPYLQWGCDGLPSGLLPALFTQRFFLLSANFTRCLPSLIKWR